MRVIVRLTGSVERASAAFGERAHDIAFGENAGDAAVGAKDEHRADTLFGEQRDGRRKLALGSILTTSRPLPARMMLTVIVASLCFTALPPARRGTAAVKVMSLMFWAGAGSIGGPRNALQRSIELRDRPKPAPTLRTRNQCGDA